MNYMLKFSLWIKYIYIYISVWQHGWLSEYSNCPAATAAPKCCEFESRLGLTNNCTDFGCYIAFVSYVCKFLDTWNWRNCLVEIKIDWVATTMRSFHFSTFGVSHCTYSCRELAGLHDSELWWWNVNLSVVTVSFGLCWVYHEIRCRRITVIIKKYN